MKVIIVDKVNKILDERLKKAGFEVHDYRTVDPAELYGLLPDYEGIIIRSKIKLDNKLLKKLHKLKFIARVGAGMESIDTDTAKSLNIKLFNAPEGNRDAVAEHAVGLILSLLNKICTANAEAKNAIWQRELNRGVEIMGKTVGIIGYGNMGKAFAKRLAGFGVNVISYDKYKKNYADKYTREVGLNEIFEKTDILSLHVPLQADTIYMVDDNFISEFRKKIYLINTARGKVVNTRSLVKHLKNGKILGAALDVLEYENMSFSDIDSANREDYIYLSKAKNVIITPHIAGLTYESDIKLANVIADKIISSLGNV